MDERARTTDSVILIILLNLIYDLDMIIGNYSILIFVKKYGNFLDIYIFLQKKLN